MYIIMESGLDLSKLDIKSKVNKEIKLMKYLIYISWLSKSTIKWSNIQNKLFEEYT